MVFRKQFGEIVRGQMTRANGTAPTSDEWLKELRSYGGRHETRALDAVAYAGDPFYYLEDQLVAFVVLSSILSGRDCLILTRRRVVRQQFISLICQLELHYRAWCIAPHEPKQQKPIDTSPESKCNLERIGYQGGAVGIRRVTQSYADECLPANALGVRLQCWLLDGHGETFKFEPMAFLAERPMHAMLECRGRTGGLTTDVLGADDITFHWVRESRGRAACVYRGQISWSEVGSLDLRKDTRVELGINRLPTKDLLSMANFCDFSEALAF